MAAIKIYFKVGFVPTLYSQETKEMWEDVCEKLSWGFEPEKWKLGLEDCYPDMAGV